MKKMDLLVDITVEDLECLYTLASQHSRPERQQCATAAGCAREVPYRRSST